MKWIVYQSDVSDLDATNYANAVKITYLLNIKVVSLGIIEANYFLYDIAEKLPFNSKLAHLIEAELEDPEEYEHLAEVKQTIKDFAKSKNKSSKQIVALNLVKKNVEARFRIFAQFCYEKYGNPFHIPVLKPLIDEENFYFYSRLNFNLPNDYSDFEFICELLKLHLPDSEKGHPMFFLSNFRKEGVLMDFDFLNPNDIEAENTTTCYGEPSYIFPLMDSLTSIQLMATRTELEKTTLEFRSKIDQWATICYANPNSNLGLEYFRTNVQSYLKSTANEVLENPMLRNVSSLTNGYLESQIIVGEVPIEKIWELFLISKTISQEVFDYLMKIKMEEFPKFEGRWPIVFFKPTEDANKYFQEKELNEGVQSVRKSISLD